MTITVYELLGLIKNGKAPKKIEYKGDTYIYSGDDYSINDNREDWLITKYDYFLTNFLTEEVEILEEDKPIIEKIEINKYNFHNTNHSKLLKNQQMLETKLNEIIDHINRKEDK